MKIKKLLLLICTLTYLILTISAQNPIVQTIYTADPAPLVYNDTVFLYVGHDEEDAPAKSFLMREYSLFTSTDMVNWTAQPTPLKTSDFKWSAADASAAQCVERNGKFYWYISTLNKNSPGVSVGVAVSDSPYGPFKDALGKALVTNNMTTFGKHSWDDLDPTVWIEDGQAYLFWGNNACYWAKLNDDMISLGSEITALDIFDQSAFGPDFEEAPWVYKRKGRYYMIYASRPNESLHYTTAKDLEGSWEYGNLLMPETGSSGSNHPAVIDYKGNSYLFYHTGELPGGGDFNRAVCIEQFEYNSDGSIPAIPKTSAGVSKSVGTLNPYRRIEAETIAWSEGLKIEENDDRGVFVTSIHDGDYIKVRDVSFGQRNPGSFKANVSSRYFGGEIELHLDSLDGELIGKLKVPYIADWDAWETLEAQVKPVEGVHDLYLVFKGGEPHEVFRFDWWRFD